MVLLLQSTRVAPAVDVERSLRIDRSHLYSNANADLLQLAQSC